ncbi:MAG: type II toxin-antitoxin system PemK/MazF family toxin [Thermomicrobiales bacterium]|nr:type II toxin-antitoxin system PemK/MazF family toxin [Thermomicrobiales bacterium]
MRRGEIWTVSAGLDYAGKPRPSVIVQDDTFDRMDSVTVCGFTSSTTDAPLIRLLIEPSERNELCVPSRLMVDRLLTVPRSKVGERIGQPDVEDLVRLNQAMMVLLGLAVSPRRAPNAE